MSEKKPAARPVIDPEPAEEARLPICGLVMPISSTVTFAEPHWAKVQRLLHRAIKLAGFEPANVWENSTKDRISERIIANIFEHDMVVVDISDFNPNVMLELGLRLASKKPTTVVSINGQPVPFDIKDFEAISYPADLNILDMEEFFARVAYDLRAKREAFSDNTYSAFLGDIVVDVLAPSAREVPLDNLILSRLDDLSRRLDNIQFQSSNMGVAHPVGSNMLSGPSQLVTSNTSNDNAFRLRLDGFLDGWKLLTLEAEGSNLYYNLLTNGRKIRGEVLSPDELSAIISLCGAEVGIPGEIAKRNKWKFAHQTRSP